MMKPLLLPFLQALGVELAKDRHPKQGDAMRPCSGLLAIGILVSSGLALTPRFSPRDVVRQARSGHSQPSSVGYNQLPDGSAFLIDTSIALAPASGSQSEPSIAFGGGNYLVVWEDERSGIDVYGARVTPQGLVLDTMGFVISEAPGWQTSPTVSFDGTNFLVAWQDNRGGGWDIYGARVTPQGAVLDLSGFGVSQAMGSQYSPALGFDGTNYLVAWVDERLSDSHIYGARVTPQGEVVDPSGFAVSGASNNQYSPSVGFDGTNYLVAWQDCDGDTNDIYGARVTPQGAVLDPAGICMTQAPGDQNNPSISSSGANLLVVWEDLRSDDCYDIYGARVTPQGAVLDPSGIVISQADDDQRDPAVSYDGAEFLVVWADKRDGDYAYGARVTPQGAVIDSTGIAITRATDVQCPAVDFDGQTFFAVWENNRSGTGDVFGARITPQGAGLDSTGLLVTKTANSQYSPAIAYDGSNLLVVWQDNRGDSAWDIYGARIAADATVLDPSGFVISQAADNQRSAAVGFDGENFLVAWEDTRNTSPFISIYGARVTPQGTVLDPLGIVIAEAFGDRYSPSVGFDGTNFLVVWQDYRDPYGDIYGARVTPQGTLLDPSGIVISHAADEQSSPAICYDGTNYLVAWQDRRNGIFSHIYGARVTPQGAVLDPTGIAISQAEGLQDCPSLDFDGGNYLVVWQGDRSGSDRDDIYGARVTPRGELLDPSGFVISHAPYNQSLPAVIPDGTNSLVVWQDARNSGNSDIYGARVTPAGVVFDSGPIIRQPRNQDMPALARGVGNRACLVYQGWTGYAGGKDYSTYRTWALMDPNPGVGEMLMTDVRTMKCGATMVRFSLGIPGSEVTSGTSIVLLDIAGRKVLDLHPGANDVRALAPGVYFVREAQAQAQAQAGGKTPGVRKIVLTK